MFAVIRAGGRQYRVAADDLIEIDRIPAEIGEHVDFDVLMVGGESGTTVGTPLVAGATVAGEVLDHPRGDKVIAFKKRRRHNSKRTRGHRQHLTLVKITDILTDGNKPAPRKAKAEKKAEPAAEAAHAEAALPVLFTAPEGPADDLKRLTGVGPAIEKKLIQIGVTRFDQIAALSADDIAKIEETLHLKGRFEREGWVAEAGALANGGGTKA